MTILQEAAALELFDLYVAVAGERGLPEGDFRPFCLRDTRTNRRSFDCVIAAR
jgi:hypothetical protein